MFDHTDSLTCFGYKNPEGRCSHISLNLIKREHHYCSDDVINVCRTVKKCILGICIQMIFIKKSF